MKNQNLSNWTDAQLVTQFQLDRSAHTFEEIYRRYSSKIYNTCLGIVRDSNLAFDLAQDISLKIYEALPRLENGFLLGYWIHRIAKNESLNYSRKLRATAVSELEDCQISEPDSFEQWELIMEKEYMLTALELALATMPEEDQELILLKYFHNWKIDELADKFQLSHSAVKMRLARARTKIAAQYHLSLPKLEAVA